MKNILKLLLVTSVFTFIKGKPQCTRTGNNLENVVCIAGSKDYILRRGLVSDNNVIKNVSLKNCRIKDIDFEAFEEMPSLTYIDISRNKLHRIRLGVLDALRSVTHLNISYNSITNIPFGLFDEMPDLQFLDLRSNKFNNIELGVFDSVTKLKYIDLSENIMISKNFSAYLFDKSKHVNFIDLSGNDMSQASDILLHAFDSLETLNLDRCNLKEVPKFATVAEIKTVKRMVFSNNQIKDIDNKTTFENLVNLEYLDLSNNKIVSINEDVFRSTNKLTVLILRHNLITNLPELLFQNFPKLNTIDLSHNKLEFVSSNTFRGSVLKNLNLSDNRFTYLQNNFCLELKNSGAKLSKFYFNDNPWQCACHNEVLNEVKTIGITYNSIKYNGKVPICVTGREFTCKRQPTDNQYFMALYYEKIKEMENNSTNFVQMNYNF